MERIAGTDPRLAELLALIVHRFRNAVSKNKKQVAGFELDTRQRHRDLVIRE